MVPQNMAKFPLSQTLVINKDPLYSYLYCLIPIARWYFIVYSIFVQFVILIFVLVVFIYWFLFTYNKISPVRYERGV